MRLLLSFFVAGALAANAAAVITIVNADAAGVGFNDPTPAAPVGINPGTTVGQQRLNAFTRAAQIWGAVLDSSVEVQVRASWPALTCDATSAVLGSAGPTTVHANFAGARQQNAWYHQALANKLSGSDRSTAQPDIVAQFNRNLGQTGCLPGRFFYLGLDNNPPAGGIDFLPTLLHELGHGLGFSTTTNAATGAFLGSNPALPSIFDFFLLDKTNNVTWDATTAATRAASAINGKGSLVWSGPMVQAGVPSVLTPAAKLTITAPTAVSAEYTGGPSTLGPALSVPVSGELMPVSSTAGGGNACAPLTGFDALAVNDKVALIDRGGCPFVTKLTNAQNAGARGVVFADTSADTPPQNITDVTPGVTIGNMLLSRADVTVLKNLLRFRSRTNSGVFVVLSTATVRAGADEADRVLMYAPSVFSSGSSVSHFDISAQRNLLMEPFSNPDLVNSVRPPQDLTLNLLLDIGWN